MPWTCTAQRRASGGRRRIALALLVLSGVVNYIDRATLAVANPLIREELGLSIGDMGLLLSAFLWAYAFAQLPVGALVDRLGPRLMLALGLGLWSLAQAAGGLVTSFSQFFAARMVLGLGEAPQFPDRRPRQPRLVQPARPRHRDRDLELLLDARHRDLGAAADLPDADRRLALDVPRSWACRHARRRHRLCRLPQPVRGRR